MPHQLCATNAHVPIVAMVCELVTLAVEIWELCVPGMYS